MVIIGLFGKKYHGKSTFARQLQKLLRHCEIVSFSRVLKRIVVEILQFPIKVPYTGPLDDSPLKKSQKTPQVDWNLAEQKLQEKLQEFNLGTMDDLDKKVLNYLRTLKTEGELYRRALQLIGTEIFRRRQKDIWIHKLDEIVQSLSVNWVIIDDCRFLNELEYVKSRNGIAVGIVRPNFGDNDTHQSEIEVDKCLPQCDYVYVCESLEKLYDAAKELADILTHGKED